MVYAVDAKIPASDLFAGIIALKCPLAGCTLESISSSGAASAYSGNGRTGATATDAGDLNIVA